MHEMNAHPGKIRVLVADDSRIHTELLVEALKRDRGLAAVAGDPDVKKLLTDSQLHHAEILVISASLNGDPNRGFEIVRELSAANPEIRTIILLDSGKREDVLDAFRAGAAGIISRHEPLETLMRCIRSVFEGQVWANSRQIKYALEALASTPTVRAVDSNGLSLLSKREIDVVQCLAEGLTNREIAERLGLSQHTIKNYLFRVFDKLGVSNRVELLFMTLSQENTQNGLPHHFSLNSAAKQNEPTTAIETQDAAQQGDAVAQLALAQLHRAQGPNPVDLLRADMWYSVVADQIEEARRALHAMMTPEQIHEAERRAADWFIRTMKILPSSDHATAKRRNAAVSGSSSAD